jgi:hypothetical protein
MATGSTPAAPASHLLYGSFATSAAVVFGGCPGRAPCTSRRVSMRRHRAGASSMTLPTPSAPRPCGGPWPGFPPRYREVIVLCDLHDLSHADAAAVIRASVLAVRSRSDRGRQWLRHELSAQWYQRHLSGRRGALHERPRSRRHGSGRRAWTPSCGRTARSLAPPRLESRVQQEVQRRLTASVSCGHRRTARAGWRRHRP